MSRKFIGIIGYTGRLGNLILKDISKVSPLFFSGLHFNRSSSYSLEEVFLKNDIVIDASSSSFIPEVFAKAAAGKATLVVATTGWSQKDYVEDLEILSKRIPVIIIPNGSFVSFLQTQCVAMLSRFLQENFDVDITERHHRNKKDELSGTAEELASTVKQIRDDCFGSEYEIRDHTNYGERPHNVIDVRSFRTGNIFGEHEVSFTGSDEMITIKHVVFDRRVFAEGIIKILASLAKTPKSPGIYFPSDFF